ncbi:MAG TPA: hypothetical protein VK492_07685 [Chitinophagaceae bacterium]|nr:hypothetical protein [Chitinophagaceae bacterium]
MTQKNKYNLDRNIPAEIARTVRKNSGFGCVICGSAFYHYDHFNPLFEEAKEHNASGITLLCAEHHDSKSRGRLSTDAIIKAVKNPKCLQDGFSYGPLEFGTKGAIIQIGSTLFFNPKSIITINGKSILSISPPDETQSPFLLTFITDDNPNANRIINNEWIGDSRSWDITTQGRKIIVKEALGKIILEIENIPGVKFILHQIDIIVQGFKVQSKNIAPKKIGSIVIQNEKIITITNPRGREIARFGETDDSLNQIRWENALEIVGEYMNGDLLNTIMKGGHLTMLSNPDNPIKIIGNIFTSVKLTYGVDRRVQEFIEITKKISEKFKKVGYNKFRLTPTEKENFKTNLRVLKHTFLINQLTEEDRKFVQALNEKL